MQVTQKVHQNINIISHLENNKLDIKENSL
jgi:hypothetical protein